MRTKPPRAALIHFDQNVLLQDPEFEDWKMDFSQCMSCVSYSHNGEDVHLRLRQDGLLDIITLNGQGKLVKTSQVLARNQIRKTEPKLEIFDYSDQFVVLYYSDAWKDATIPFFVFEKCSRKLLNEGRAVQNIDLCHQWYLHSSMKDTFLYGFRGFAEMVTLKLQQKKLGDLEFVSDILTTQIRPSKCGSNYRKGVSCKSGGFHVLVASGDGFVDTLFSFDPLCRIWQERKLSGWIPTITSMGNVYDAGNNTLMIASRIGNMISGCFFFLNTDVAFMSQINFGTLITLPSICCLRFGEGSFLFSSKLSAHSIWYVVTLKPLPKEMVRRAENIIAPNYSKLSQFSLCRIRKAF